MSLLGWKGVTTDDMTTMKRLAFCMVLLWFAAASMADGEGGDPVKSPAPVPAKTEETLKPEQEVPLLDSILSQMDASYRKLQSYRAEFEQESETKTFKRKSQASGRVYFLKPSEMRWDYLQPEVKRSVPVRRKNPHLSSRPKSGDRADVERCDAGRGTCKALHGGRGTRRVLFRFRGLRRRRRRRMPTAFA